MHIKKTKFYRYNNGRGYIQSTVNSKKKKQKNVKMAIASQLSIVKECINGYLLSTAISQKTLKWLFTVNCH